MRKVKLCVWRRGKRGEGKKRREKGRGRGWGNKEIEGHREVGKGRQTLESGCLS